MNEAVFKDFLVTSCNFDSSHGLAHITRVVKNARKILQHEKNANREVVIAAAWLHDCVILPKNHADRSKASQLAAKKATQFLEPQGFETQEIKAVAHAIEAHSFSAGIRPETIEAKIVQDADRLDALGAIGISRCLMIGGQLDRELYKIEDPFCVHRVPDDSGWTIDHFYTKLFKLPGLMHTESAKKEAETRVRFMENYLQILKKEEI